MFILKCHKLFEWETAISYNCWDIGTIFGGRTKMEEGYLTLSFGVRERDYIIATYLDSNVKIIL